MEDKKIDEVNIEKSNDNKIDWKSKGTLLSNGVGSLLLGALAIVIAFYMRDYHIDCECVWQALRLGVFIMGVIFYLIGFICITLHIDREQKRKRNNC